MIFKAYVEKDFPFNDLKLFIVGEESGGRRAIATMITMQNFAPGTGPAVGTPGDTGRIIDPAIGSQRQFLQALMDAAWDAGLRPTGHTNIAEAAKATDQHLQDMRTIAFHKLGIDPK